MVNCPWCGTNYPEFRPDCRKCGGPLPKPGEFDDQVVLRPPPPPREISKNYGYKLLMTDGWAIGSFVFLLMGGIFSLVGIVLTLAIVTAFVGIPFFLLGLCELGVGIAGIVWRNKIVKRTLDVLREGLPVDGKIDSVEENMMVRVNRRHPWVIAYSFDLGGRKLEGKVSTLTPPSMKPGQPYCVLYLQEQPELNTLYPHP